MTTRYSNHPSAEEFLRQLILFIDSHGSELISRRGAFKLQPRALEYVAQRLEALFQLQRVKNSNPIRFLAGAVADLTDFLRMEKVQQFCSLVKHLKLYSQAQDIKDPTPVDFTPFKSLNILEVRGCDLSSVCPKGVDNIRASVETIVCQDSLESLWHLLEPSRIDAVDRRESQKWMKLKRLSVIYNQVKDIDTSIRLAPNLKVLDLSRNQIVHAQNLRDLNNLVAIDLSYNQLVDLGEITFCVGLQRLFLQSNGIASLEGIGNLVRLEELDLRWNVISSLADVAKLKRLTSLRLISLDGNPISDMYTYRLHVLACLLEIRDDIVLDSKPANDVEKKKAKKLLVSLDGTVDYYRAESVSTAPSPSFWDFFSPFRLPKKGRVPSSNSDLSQRLITDEEEPEFRVPQKAVKRIVDLPDTSYPESTAVEVDTRTIPRTNIRLSHQHSRDLSFIGSLDEAKFASLGLVSQKELI